MRFQKIIQVILKHERICILIMLINTKLKILILKMKLSKLAKRIMKGKENLQHLKKQKILLKDNKV